MDSETIIAILSRWVHVGTAIVMLGGSFYLRWVVMPAAMELPAAELDAFRERLKARARKIIGIGIGLLLLTGFYNYLAVAAPAHEGANRGLYHALMGTKIILAFAMFFIASALAGRSARFEGMRQKSAGWLTILVLVGAAVVAIAGVLKVAVPPSTAEEAPEETPVTMFYSLDDGEPA